MTSLIVNPLRIILYIYIMLGSLQVLTNLSLIILLRAGEFIPLLFHGITGTQTDWIKGFVMEKEHGSLETEKPCFKLLLTTNTPKIL